ncbi:NAD-dependent epimerase/dehydratase family protein [Candidatus Pelagibacter bacterium]|jgi:nucleoside-diphosphate-sugar epimerase|nr:NAD-dependent epimerase/dehydratase family protein [Candidatus Pelagibacter bacterium]
MFDLEKLKGKRVAIVGGAGFIGHNLALKLKKLGAEPYVIDGLQVNNIGYYTSDYEKNENAERYIAFINERLSLLRKVKINLKIIDVRDYHATSIAISEIKPEAVVHLAAIAHANRSNKDPFSTFDHSMRTLENVLDVTRSNGIHVIYFSSSMVYGNFDGEAVTEERICSPMGIYGALKYGAEKLVIGYNQVFDLPYTIIRPSALYGERCVSRRVGQAFIENALVGQDLTVNGDGTEGLDFTYIDDLVQGIILSITKPESINQIFNITFGAARSINQLAEIVMEKFPGIKLNHKTRDGLMPERGTLSIAKAQKLLGYNPQHPVEKGFVQYINWYKNFAESNPQFFKK